MKAEGFSARFANRSKNADKFIRFDFKSLELLVRHRLQSFYVIQPKRGLIRFLQRNPYLIDKILFGTPALGRSIIGGRRTRATNNLIGSIATGHGPRHGLGHLRDAEREPQKTLAKFIMHSPISSFHGSYVSKFLAIIRASLKRLTSPFLLLPYRGGTTR